MSNGTYVNALAKPSEQRTQCGCVCVCRRTCFSKMRKLSSWHWINIRPTDLTLYVRLCCQVVTWVKYYYNCSTFVDPFQMLKAFYSKTQFKFDMKANLLWFFAAYETQYFFSKMQIICIRRVCCWMFAAHSYFIAWQSQNEIKRCAHKFNNRSYCFVHSFSSFCFTVSHFMQSCIHA